MTKTGLILASGLVMIAGCEGARVTDSGDAISCNESWYQLVESLIPTGDGQGHGPDYGSEEWRSVIEFRLGIREDESVPALTSPQWCAYIHRNYIQTSS
ncbi:hypothetical protein HMF8227_00203 [Saliniradius amylolyticus]|uniref:Lipoprotein n=1 Tax=Saliniradius amylolyticus TaxID=2183582 RepID=A0A2S2DZ92_9ALTE|nr:hypothetical protein [Saliniradius amylolyticus]AWL10711.1 hypothetical protein HMF8227_00203 [Saliniradius amylolyticus]